MSIRGVVGGSMVGHQRKPTWQTLWAQINRRLARLARIYADTERVRNTGDVEDEVDALLLCLANLWDWMGQEEQMKKDRSSLLAIRNRDPLALCFDYANTFKHHTRESRDGGVLRSARISQTSQDAWGIRVKFRYWLGDSEDETVLDALDFAYQCFDEWMVFLKAEGMLE